MKVSCVKSVEPLFNSRCAWCSGITTRLACWCTPDAPVSDVLSFLCLLQLCGVVVLCIPAFTSHLCKCVCIDVRLLISPPRSTNGSDMDHSVCLPLTVKVVTCQTGHVCWNSGNFIAKVLKPEHPHPRSGWGQGEKSKAYAPVGAGDQPSTATHYDHHPLLLLAALGTHIHHQGWPSLTSHLAIAACQHVYQCDTRVGVLVVCRTSYGDRASLYK